MLYVGMDGMGWMVIIVFRSSKSTFGANNITQCQNINAKNANIAQSKMQGGIPGYIYQHCPMIFAIFLDSSLSVCTRCQSTPDVC